MVINYRIMLNFDSYCFLNLEFSSDYILQKVKPIYEGGVNFLFFTKTFSFGSSYL